MRGEPAARRGPGPTPAAGRCAGPRRRRRTRDRGTRGAGERRSRRRSLAGPGRRAPTSWAGRGRRRWTSTTRRCPARHAELTVGDDGSVSARDCGSLNGTCVAARRRAHCAAPRGSPAGAARAGGRWATPCWTSPRPAPSGQRPPGRRGAPAAQPAPAAGPPGRAAGAALARGERRPQRPGTPRCWPCSSRWPWRGCWPCCGARCPCCWAWPPPCWSVGQWWTQRRRYLRTTDHRAAELTAGREAVRRTHREALTAEHELGPRPRPGRRDPAGRGPRSRGAASSRARRSTPTTCAAGWGSATARPVLRCVPKVPGTPGRRRCRTRCCATSR